MDDLRVRRGLVIPAAELRAAASRSGGPGGQHVNKASTRVTLRWNVEHSEALSDRQRARLRSKLDRRLTHGGDLVVHAGRARSRARNLESARERLAQLVADALATTRARIATKPGARQRARRVQQKRRRSVVKRQRRRPEVDD